MRILLTNDDGIFAQGIIALAEIVKALGQVYVAAPNRERSAVSHGITVHEPLVVKETEYPIKVEKAYMVSGKPADCVRVAVCDLLPVKPDIILSGINAGPNFGQDIFYSGTVSAAIEGMFYEIPSVAFSLDGNNFDTCRECIPRLIKEYLESDNKNRIWNINFPSIPIKDCKGVIKAPLSGHSQFPFQFKKYQSAEKEWYYFPDGQAVGALEKGSDVDYVLRGYISITPLSVYAEQHLD